MKNNTTPTLITAAAFAAFLAFPVWGLAINTAGSEAGGTSAEGVPQIVTVDERDAELVALRNHLVETATQLTRTATQLGEATREAARLKEENEQLRHQAATLQAGDDHTELEAEADALRSEVVRLTREVERLTLELGVARSTPTQLAPPPLAFVAEQPLQAPDMPLPGTSVPTTPEQEAVRLDEVVRVLLEVTPRTPAAALMNAMPLKVTQATPTMLRLERENIVTTIHTFDALSGALLTSQMTLTDNSVESILQPLLQDLVSAMGMPVLGDVGGFEVGGRLVFETPQARSTLHWPEAAMLIVDFNHEGLAGAGGVELFHVEQSPVIMFQAQPTPTVTTDAQSPASTSSVMNDDAAQPAATEDAESAGTAQDDGTQDSVSAPTNPEQPAPGVNAADALAAPAAAPAPAAPSTGSALIWGPN